MRKKNSDHTVYLIAKCAAVDLIEYYHQHYGLKKFIFRLSEKDRLLFEKNFFLSGVNSKAEYIRRLITNYEVPSKLDVAHINELRRLAGLFGKNTGLLKLHISSLDDISKKRIDMVIKDNEKLKKEIKGIISNLKNDLGIV